MKKLGIALVVLIAILSGALFWLRGNVDVLLRDALVRYGSEMTQAQTGVGRVKIDATNGKGVISDLNIGNPTGFKTSHAFKVKEISVVIDPASLAGDVVTVKKIAILAPDIVYEKGEVMTNFDAIQKNITDYLGPSDEKPSEKKLIVDELTIRSIKAQASAPFMGGKTMSIKLQDLVLHNLGKEKGGITPGELGQIVASALKKQLTGAVSFNKLGKAMGETAGVAAKSAKDAVGKVKSLF